MLERRERSWATRIFLIITVPEAYFSKRLLAWIFQVDR